MSLIQNLTTGEVINWDLSLDPCPHGYIVMHESISIPEPPNQEHEWTPSLEEALINEEEVEDESSEGDEVKFIKKSALFKAIKIPKFFIPKYFPSELSTKSGKGYIDIIKHSFGLDAEFIIRDKKTHLPVSMIGKLGGSKQKPLKVPRGALQEDGVLAEINIRPAKSLFEWETNITTVLHYLEKAVEKMGCYVDYNSIEEIYPDSELNHSLAWQSGCDPDYNCWTEERNPIVPYETPLRTCGGHIHIGFRDIDQYKPNFRAQVARQLDLGVGIPLFVIEPPNNRRSIYGKPGAYRPKPYGVELRTPSNFWLKSPILRKYAFFLLCNFTREKHMGGCGEGYYKDKGIASKYCLDYGINFDRFKECLFDFYDKSLKSGTVTKRNIDFLFHIGSHKINVSKELIP